MLQTHSPRTVLNVGHFYRVTGGSDSYMLSLERLLSQHGHTVIPFATQNDHNQDTEWSAYFPRGVNTRSPRLGDFGRYLYSTEARQKLTSVLRAANVNIAHLHLYYGQLTSSILQPLKSAGIPVVQTLHDYKLTCSVHTHRSNGRICEDCAGRHFIRAIPMKCKDGSLLRTALSVMESYLLALFGDVRNIDHFIAPSEFMRDVLLRHKVVGPERVTTIHNFVDVPPVQSPFVGKYFLYFGRLSAEKGIQTLVEAMKGIDIPLLIVGDGPERARLERLAADLETTNVSFLGFRSGQELQTIVRESRCAVVPSEWYENCPMSVLESMAVSKPVIGARIGGIPELVREDDNGLLFESGNVESLREALTWAAGHDTKLADMAHRSRERIENEFSAEEHYRKIAAVYALVEGSAA